MTMTGAKIKSEMLSQLTTEVSLYGLCPASGSAHLMGQRLLSRSTIMALSQPLW